MFIHLALLFTLATSAIAQDIVGGLSLSDGAILIRKVEATKSSTIYRCYRWENGAFTEGPRPLFLPGVDAIKWLVSDYDAKGRLVVRVLFGLQTTRQYTHLWYPFETLGLDQTWEEPLRASFMKSGGEGQVATVLHLADSIEVKTGRITDRELESVIRYEGPGGLISAEYAGNGTLLVAGQEQVDQIRLSGRGMTQPNAKSRATAGTSPYPGVKTESTRITKIIPGEIWKFGLIVYWTADNPPKNMQKLQRYAVQRSYSLFNWIEDLSKKSLVEYPLRASRGQFVYAADYIKALAGQSVRTSSGIETLPEIEEELFRKDFHFLPVDSEGTIPGSRPPPAQKMGEDFITHPGEITPIESTQEVTKEPTPTDPIPSVDGLAEQLLKEHQAAVKALGPFRRPRTKCLDTFDRAIIEQYGGIPTE